MINKSATYLSAATRVIRNVLSRTFRALYRLYYTLYYDAVRFSIGLARFFFALTIDSQKFVLAFRAALSSRQGKTAQLEQQ